jgi:hypothetical protein
MESNHNQKKESIQLRAETKEVDALPMNYEEAVSAFLKVKPEPKKPKKKR